MDGADAHEGMSQEDEEIASIEGADNQLNTPETVLAPNQLAPDR